MDKQEINNLKNQRKEGQKLDNVKNVNF